MQAHWEFKQNIITLKYQAIMSKNAIKDMLNIVATLQAHPFYADQDIMSQVSDCQNKLYLSSYIFRKVQDITFN